MPEVENSLYWADQLADTIIDTFPDKETYTVASGITPSGLTHIGHFREIITVDLVAKALQDKGKQVRFIYSWDDFDRFRKVPQNVPDDFEQYIGRPVHRVPDPGDCHDSYAAHFEDALEEQLAPLNMDIEYIYQHEMFRNCVYSNLMKQAATNRDKIRDILNQFRNRNELGNDWMPLRVYCPDCGKDFTTITDYDEEYLLTITCDECGDEKTVDFSQQGVVKPPWRVDWPMRWVYEDVVFEPGGKDHSAAGSSRDTGKRIVEQVFDRTAPIYQMYDFVNIKGQEGKMSSSTGNVVEIGDALAVYEPAVFRYVFASTKPRKEFDLAFDEEIFQVYKNFDDAESLYFGEDSLDNEKREEHVKRVYELSQVNIPEEKPVRIPFKHAALLAQLFDQGEWEEAVPESLAQTGHIKNPETLPAVQRRLVLQRLEKALFWAEHYAPDRYDYTLNQAAPDMDVTREQEYALERIHDYIVDTDDFTDAKQVLFDIKDDAGLKTKQFFQTMYQVLFSRDHGPQVDTILQAADTEQLRALFADAINT